jgi:hypothetical protein
MNSSQWSFVVLTFYEHPLLCLYSRHSTEVSYD